jgi:hypothetical protein
VLVVLLLVLLLVRLLLVPRQQAFRCHPTPSLALACLLVAPWVVAVLLLLLLPVCCLRSPVSPACTLCHTAEQQQQQQL